MGLPLPGSNPHHGSAVTNEQSIVHPILTPSCLLATHHQEWQWSSHGEHCTPRMLKRVMRIAQIRWERRWQGMETNCIQKWWQLLPLVWVFHWQNLSALGGFAPWPPLWALPQTPIIGSHSALAIIVHPTFLHVATLLLLWQRCNWLHPLLAHVSSN